MRERLIAMLFLAALLHAIVILGLTFSAAGHRESVPRLSVMLVTDTVPAARSNPHAAYLAQRTQLGSGNTGASGPTGSPGSSAPAGRPGAPAQSSAVGTRSGTTPHQVLTSAAGSQRRYVGNAPAARVPGTPAQQPAGRIGPLQAGRGNAPELMLRGPSRSARWVIPDTRASALAPYLAAWKSKVERIGTLNFPSAARITDVSEGPVIEVQVRADGRLVHASVQRSSGDGAIDQAALAILRLASPFDPFPARLAAHYSQLRFAYQWDFLAAQHTVAVKPSAVAPSGP